MTIDERLQFLLQSTESLHATVAEMGDRMEREHAAHQAETAKVEAEAAKHRRAIILAIQAYLDDLTNGESEG